MIKERLLRNFRGKNVLVTGGTGLIGRQVVDILCEAGASVRICSLDKVKVHPKAEHCLGDLTEFGFCKETIKGSDFVFHLAGIKGSIEVSKTKLASHFVPTLMMNTNVLEACRVAKVKKAVYTSSIGAYAPGKIFKESYYKLASEPMDFAGWAKRVGELQVQAYKIQYGMWNIAIVRPSNVYGPGDNFDPENAMVIPSLMSRIYHGENPLIVWGSGKAIRDFVFSRDVAEGAILALIHGTGGGFVNLGGGGGGVSILRLVQTLRKFISFDYVFDATKPSGAPKKLMDISLAKRTLGYQPQTPLLEGLQMTWDWFMKHSHEYWQKKNYFKEP